MQYFERPQYRYSDFKNTFLDPKTYKVVLYKCISATWVFLHDGTCQDDMLFLYLTPPTPLFSRANLNLSSVTTVHKQRRGKQ
jgi:hypothetical protein